MRWTSALLHATVTAVLLAACSTHEPPLERLEGYAQGTTYALRWWRQPSGASSAVVSAAIENELERIDALLSTYRPDSAIERFNAALTTEPQPVPAELAALVTLARRVHAASDGCFDPTVRPLVRAWGFDGDDPRVPARAVLEGLRARIGLPLVESVDERHLRKGHPQVEIDLSSIGQGYTAARLAAILEELGIANYLVELGGEIVARGARPDGAQWRVGVESPLAPSESAEATANADEDAVVGADVVAETVAGTVAIPADGRAFAVITSGTYRRYFNADGERLSHILDPRTLAPVRHRLVAVTVMATDAAVAAAWATALVCLGPEAAMSAAEREHIAALLLLDRGGAIEQRPSSSFPLR